MKSTKLTTHVKTLTLILAVAAMAILFLANAPAYAAVTLSLEITSTGDAADGYFFYNVELKYAGGTQELRGANVNITFNASEEIVQLTSITVEDFLENGGQDPFLDYDPKPLPITGADASVTINTAKLGGAGSSGTGTLATLRFDGVADGATTIHIVDDEDLRDGGNASISDVTTTDVTITTAGVSLLSVVIEDTTMSITDYVKDNDGVTITATGTAVGGDGSINFVKTDLVRFGGGAGVNGTLAWAGTDWTATWVITPGAYTADDDSSDGTITITVSVSNKKGKDPPDKSGTIILDNTVPVVTAGSVACVKDPVPGYPSGLDAEYVKDGDGVKLTATITDANVGAMTSAMITADFSPLGGAIDMAANGGDPSSGSPEWTLTVNNATGEEAQKTINLTVEDKAGNVAIGDDLDDTINLDNILPTAVGTTTAFAAAPSNADTPPPYGDRVKLTWTGGGTDTNDAGLVIRRNAWGGTDYPEYPSANEPSYPGASGGALVTGMDGLLISPQKDTDNDGLTEVGRNIYYYQIFAYDKAGNFSAATASQQARATNYQLGDFYDEGGDTYDGIIDIGDLGDFSIVFGTSPATNPECDIGPTHDNSLMGIPLPDDAIEFEDLMIFAMNFNTPLPAPYFEPMVFPEGVPLVSLNSQQRAVAKGEIFPVALKLSHELRAKGAHLVLNYDPRYFEVVKISKGNLGMTFFKAEDKGSQIDINVAALGTDVPLADETIATVEFRAKGSAPNTALYLSKIDVRGVRNEGANDKLANLGRVGLNLSVGKPDATKVFHNYPNPFNPETWIPFQLEKASDVLIKIYDVRGQLVKTIELGHVPAGYYLSKEQSVRWDGKNSLGEKVSSGIYFYQFQAGNVIKTNKMVILK